MNGPWSDLEQAKTTQAMRKPAVGCVLAVTFLLWGLVALTFAVAYWVYKHA